MSVNPGEAAQGDYTKLAFRVPNESDKASTVKVRVSFPTDTPLASVRVKPHAGWTADISRSTLPKPVDVGDLTLEEAVTSITWTADKGARIGPGQFDEFEVSVGPLPKTRSLAFPTAQTYDNGDVVTWSQPVREGAAEPEHPAPTLTLTASAGDGSHGSTSGTAAPAGDTTATGADGMSEAATQRPVDQTARTLGIAGLGTGVAGVAVAAFAIVAARRKGAA